MRFQIVSFLKRLEAAMVTLARMRLEQLAALETMDVEIQAEHYLIQKVALQSTET